MKKIICCMLLLSLVFIKCAVNETSASPDYADLLKAANEDPVRGPLCIVFCDFTTSIDSISTMKIIKDARDIFKTLYSSYELHFYAVDDNDYSSPFFSWKPILIKDIKPSEESMLEEYYKANEPGGERKLLDTIAYLSKRNKLGRSCMINAIKKAIREFDNYDSSKNISLKLIFLSDMLERCRCSLGDFNLENKQFGSAISQLSQAAIPDLSFTKFKRLDIEIVISSNKNTEGDKLDLFWHELFSKFGYGQLPHLSPIMPSLKGGQ